MKKRSIIFLFIFSLFFQSGFGMDGFIDMPYFPARRDIGPEDLRGMLAFFVLRNYPWMIESFKSHKNLFKGFIDLFEEDYGYRKTLNLVPHEFCVVANNDDSSMFVCLGCKETNCLEIHFKQTRRVCSKEEFLFIKRILSIITMVYFGEDITEEDHSEPNSEESGKFYIVIKVRHSPSSIIKKT